MTARDELVGFLQRFLAPDEIAAVLKTVAEMTNDAFASGYAKGFGRGREADCRCTEAANVAVEN